MEVSEFCVKATCDPEPHPVPIVMSTNAKQAKPHEDRNVLR
jgi:hypothetical protein